MKSIKCSNPLFILNEEHPYYNTSKLKYCNYLKYDDLYKSQEEIFKKKFGSFENGITELVNKEIYHVARCKRCNSCINNNRYIWTQRITFESSKYEYLYFITLTYSDDNLTYDDLNGKMTLNVSDYQKFFKRLRKSGMVFKYLISGEYGPRNGRPHFHILLMTNNLIPVTPLKNSRRGINMYYSKFINDKWGLGFHSIEIVENCKVVSYLTLYSSKQNTSQFTNDSNRYYYWKLNQWIKEPSKYGDFDCYADDLIQRYYENRKPEFVRCSQGLSKVLWNYDTTPSYLLKQLKNDKTASLIVENRKVQNIKNIKNSNLIETIKENKILNDIKNYKNSKNDI